MAPWMKKQEGNLFLHLAFPLTLKVRPPHITLSLATTADGIRSPSSRGAQRAGIGIHQRHRIQGRQGRTPSSSLVRGDAEMVPAWIQSVDSSWLSAHLRLGSCFVLELVVYPQRVSQHLFPPLPGRFLPARPVVYPAVPCQQILRGHWRRCHCFLHLHVGGGHVPVVVGDVPHLDEPLPTRGTFLPATGHAGCSHFHTGRPCLGNIYGFLV